MNEYTKLDNISHCHKRPDMYIGDNKFMKKHAIIYEEDKLDIQEGEYCDGVLRLFIELLSNSMDNFYRSKETETPMTRIDVFFDSDTNRIDIKNDGCSIPVQMHEKEKIYIPELIFGHLLSSSNYDDSVDRITSGRNGLGGKLTNVFSKIFSIECFDYSSGLVYKQKWTENMRKVSKPKIVPKTKGEKIKSGYTKVSYEIDFTKFKGVDNQYMNEQTKYNSMTICCMRKYLVDASMLMNGIPVYFNKEKLQIKNGVLLEYGKLYNELFFDLKEKKESIEGKFESKRCVFEYCILPSKLNSGNVPLESISFINGINTKDGGIHEEILYQKIFQYLGKFPKFKKYNLSLKDLKKYISIIIRASVTNPSFSSQSKTKLVNCKDNLISLINFKEDDKNLNKLLKWTFMNEIKENFELKEELQLKSQEKKRGYRSIANYDKANNSSIASKKKDCTLILTEGLSAKTFAVKALQYGINGKKGRSWFGVFPLKGKLLNAKNASSQTIANNKEITDIIQILNLRYNLDYTIEKNFNTLSYGRLLILADSDVDGKHIASLIILMFNHLFPSLLKREESFIQVCLTPIAKVSLKNNLSMTFYSDQQYKKFLEDEEQKDKIKHVKYFKGLGTSTQKEIAKFADKIVNITHNGKDSDNALDISFHKMKTNERKEWMMDYDEEKYIDIEVDYSIPMFLNQELILYSIDDCHRSIGSVKDGLKPSQRKILYCVFKKHLDFKNEKQIKVAQLSGYVSEQTNYHHGEECLNQSIIKMAQNYAGSNNVPLLADLGQFGSRGYKGLDAASPRYVFTKLGPLTNIIFNQLDNPLLKHAFDDGQKVEFENYAPIIPLVLVNGITSIGTGWSSHIPSFNLLQIIEKIKCLLNDNLEHFEQIQMVPFFNGFQGKILPTDDKKKFQCHGIVEEKEAKNNKHCYVIKEIPIDSSIDNYKTFLEKKIENKEIKDMKNLSTANTAHFEFQLTENNKNGFSMEEYKLISSISLNNMVLFNLNNKIEKYKSVDDIILDFYSFRLELYKERVQFLIRDLQRRKLILENRSRFIMAIVNNEICLIKINEEEVNKSLEQKNYHKVDESYDYLLSMNIRSLTRNRYDQMKSEINDLERQIHTLEHTNVKDIWNSELKELEKEYQKYYV